MPPTLLSRFLVSPSALFNRFCCFSAWMVFFSAAGITAHAQATAPAVSLTSVAVGSNTTGTVTFTFSASTTVSTISVVTQGATGLDFALNSAAPGSCTAATYASAATCTVGVKFTPTAAGIRYGAANLLDGSGNILASGVVTGTGVAPLPVFPLGPGSTVSTIFTQPNFLSIDSSGNVYQPSQNHILYKVTPAGVVSSFYNGGSGTYVGSAVDPAGNVYVADAGSAKVYKLNAAGTLVATWPASGTTLSSPQGMAFDTNGNLYVADAGLSKIVVISPAGAAAPLTVTGYTFQAYAVAVDASNTVYISDYSHTRILKVTSAGAASVLTITSGSIASVNGIAVDAAGNIYLAEAGSSIIAHVTPGGVVTNITPTLNPTVNYPVGIALDGHGLLYFSDQGRSALDKVNLLAATFAASGTTAVGSSSAQQTATVENDGNATATFTSVVISGAATQGAGNTCVTSTPLATDATCVAAIQFSPTTHTASPQTGTLTLSGSNFASDVESISGYVTGDPTQLVYTTAPAASFTAGGNGGSAIAVTLEDSTGATAVNDTTAPVTLTVTGPNSYSHTYGPTNAVNSVATFNTSGNPLTHAGTYTYTATSTGLTNATATETVTGGPAASLSVTPQFTFAIPGGTDNVTITGYDIYGNVAASSDSIALTSSDASATYTASVALSSGTVTTPIKFMTPGSQTVTATDTTNNSVPAATSTAITVTNAVPAFVVTSSADDGTGSCTDQTLSGATLDSNCQLRSAIAATNSAGIIGTTAAQPAITFQAGITSIVLTSVLAPTANFNLTGPGAATLNISPSGSGFSFIRATTANLALTISGVKVSGFSATAGSAIYITASPHALTLTNVTFSGNAATSAGGAIYESSGTLTMSGCTFLGNSVPSSGVGGAVELATTNSTITNTVFGSAASPNTAGPGGNGGALYLAGAGTQTLTGVTFLGNTAGSLGGALYISGASSVTISGSVFGSVAAPNKTAISFGGAIYSSNSPLTISNTTFLGNTASAAAGGAIYHTGTKAITITQSTFGSTATGGGNSGTFGGAVYVNAQASGLTETISQSNFIDNKGTTAFTGGAIFLTGGTAFAPTFNISGNNFIGNTQGSSSALGGALYNSRASSKSTLNLMNNFFQGNSVSGSNSPAGGAVYESAASTNDRGASNIVGNTFVANSLPTTSGTDVGSALYENSSYSTVVIDNNTFTQNINNNTGATEGAVFINALNTVATSFYNNIVANNTSGANATYPDLYTTGTVSNNCTTFCNNGSAASSTINTATTLSAYANYGGPTIGATGSTLPTYTMIPLPGSSALGAGSTAYTSVSNQTCNGSPTAVDARGCGYPRQLGTLIDAGAAEANYTLSFVTQPANTPLNTALLPPPTVQIYESNVPFGSTGGTLALAAAAGTPSITSVATTASGLESLAPVFTTVESDDSLIVSVQNSAAVTVASETSSTFNITDTAAAGIGFVKAPPPTLETGGNAGTVTVALLTSGSVNTSATALVTLMVTGPSYTQTYTATPVKGVASFDLSSAALATAGTYTYTATAATYTTSSSDSAVTSETVSGYSVWVLDASGVLVKLSTAGALVSTAGVSGTSANYGGVAFDASGDIWSVTSGTNSVMYTPAGSTTTSSYTGGGLNAPSAIALDGVGSVWIANSGNNTVTEFTGGRVAMSPSVGYGTSAALSAPSSVAIDLTGGVWIANKTGNSVTHVFGAAQPVVTPLSNATATGTLGSKP